MTDLPNGWIAERLEQLVDFNPKHDPWIDRSTTVSFVPMAAVDEFKGTIVARTDRPLHDVWTGFTHFSDNDVIFAKITPCMENGKFALATGMTNGLACGSTEFHVMRSRGAIHPDYLWRYLRQQSFRDDAARSMTGAVGQRRVPTQYLKAVDIPLPPLAEQRRIVAKLNVLTARTARARADLDRIPALTARYKQAILEAAFSQASKLAKIQTTLGGIALQVRNGLSRRPAAEPPGVPILKISAARSMAAHLGERRYYATEEGENVEPFHLNNGDLLFVRFNGNPALVAVCAMVRNLHETLVYPDKLIRVRIDPNAAMAQYIEIIASSPQVRNQLREHIKTAAGQHGISGGDLKAISLPLPSQDVQRAIIERVSVALNEIDRLAAEAAAARRLLDRLDQAILAKAFRGELVPQDPADEPASALLERIKAERAAVPPSGRGRRGLTER